jgi:hypothetical protein
LDEGWLHAGNPLMLKQQNCLKPARAAQEKSAPCGAE